MWLYIHIFWMIIKGVYITHTKSYKYARTSDMYIYIYYIIKLIMRVRVYLSYIDPVMISYWHSNISNMHFVYPWQSPKEAHISHQENIKLPDDITLRPDVLITLLATWPWGSVQIGAKMNIIIWPWVKTYGTVFGWMNIHLPSSLLFTRVPRFCPMAIYLDEYQQMTQLMTCISL